MTDLSAYELNDEEIKALETLRVNGWRVAVSTYVEDSFESDDGFEEGRQGIAICKA